MHGLPMKQEMLRAIMSRLGTLISKPSPRLEPSAIGSSQPDSPPEKPGWLREPSRLPSLQLRPMASSDEKLEESSSFNWSWSGWGLELLNS